MLVPLSCVTSAGSSPRMRGTGRPPCDGGRARRFIPAHAGNSIARARTQRSSPVHPRACGEQMGFSPGTRRLAGSSPRMRGTAGTEVDAEEMRRFIPAHAGNRPGVWRGWSRPPVHPRACGEQAYGVQRKADGGGSSPRMRGTVQVGIRGLVGHRFIPAHAGNSTTGNVRVVLYAVHPRACGEQRLAVCLWPITIGSSPRMRGTGHRPGVEAACPRFIPAHAGNRSAGDPVCSA